MQKLYGSRYENNAVPVYAAAASVMYTILDIDIDSKIMQVHASYKSTAAERYMFAAVYPDTECIPSLYKAWKLKNRSKACFFALKQYFFEVFSTFSV